MTQPKDTIVDVIQLVSVLSLSRRIGSTNTAIATNQLYPVPLDRETKYDDFILNSTPSILLSMKE